MPHFAEEPFADDPEQLEALFRLLHGPQPGSPGRPAPRPEPPTLEARFGVRADRAPEPGAHAPRRSRPALRACRIPGSG